MIRDIICVGLVLTIAVASGEAQAATVGHEETKRDGTTRVVLFNDLYRLTFDPARGGRCSSFFIKATGREWVYDGKTAGLFQDHFAHQGYPGELLNSPYEYEVQRDGDAAITIRLWRVAKGGEDGRDVLTQGVRVEKRITLWARRRHIDVVNTFANPTAKGKNVGLWVQQCFCYGGQRLYDTYYRPSTHGIHLAGRDDTGHHPVVPVLDVYSTDFVGAGKYTDAGGREPVAGWTAGRDRRTNEGAVFLLDYNYLDVLYNSAGSFTSEWFLDPVPLPPGKSWTTQYTIVPVDGFTGFSHASRRIIANTAVAPEAGRVRLTHQFAGGIAPAGTVTVETVVYGVRSRKTETLPAQTVKDVGLRPVTVTQVWDRAQTEPLAVRVAVRGRDWQQRYEILFDGEFGGTGIAGAGQLPEYTVPRPAKKKTFLKPDSWTRRPNKHPRVLLVYGLYTNHYGIEQAVKALDPQAELTVTPKWGNFPATYGDLLRYDLVILSNVPAGPDYANVMIADVVRRAGVSAMVLGGISTYGGGQWRGTPLADILPAEIRSNFDLQPLRPAAHPRPSSTHAVTRGVAFPPGARVFWSHELKPRPGSTVLLAGGGRPLLIVGKAGKGRVAAFAATCHGEPAADQVEAWTTPAWSTLLKQTMTWLMGRDANAVHLAPGPARNEKDD